MSLIYIVIWGFVLLAGVTSISALAWSINDGQWRATAEDANSIFELDDSPKAPDKTSVASGLSTRGD